MEDLLTFLRLLLGTIIYRPYVYAFLTAFIVFATYHMGWKRMLTFTIGTYLITFACEWASTNPGHWFSGFPFGPYTYFDDTRARELWISNIPFWDSLSFVFLSYFSYIMAAALITPAKERLQGNWSGMHSRMAPWFGGVIMMLLDVVIDPLTLQGEKWFLGRIYNYPYEGFYFGVTAANFAGWFFVGFATQWVFQKMLKFAPWCRDQWHEMHPLFVWGIYAVYAGIFAFNFIITLYVKDYRLAQASALVCSATLVLLAWRLKGMTWLAPQQSQNS